MSEKKEDGLQDVLDAVTRLGKPSMHIRDDGTWFVQLDLYSNSPQAKVIITNAAAALKTPDLKPQLEFVLAEAVRTIHQFEFGKPKGPIEQTEYPPSGVSKSLIARATWQKQLR